MSTRTRYHAGGFIAAAVRGNKAEEWNGSAGTYTSWNVAGTQTSQRALTAAEVAELAAQDASDLRLANGSTLTAQATAAIASNETWINTTSPQVQSAMDSIQAATWPTKPGASTTIAQVNTVLALIWDQVLVPLVAQVAQLSQSVETDNAALTKALRDLDATMRLVAGALDSTSGT